MLAETAISNRKGQVLLKNTILKEDHFPGCQNKMLMPNFEDAPNFRRVPELPIFGVATPTVSGLHIVLDILEAKQRKVLWHNLREEPILYINGNPFVVREADKPFANLEYTGIDRKRVEAMEERLKQDVIQEMQQYKGRALLTGENDDSEMIQYWEPVTEEAIQTPKDVFQQLVQLDGYNVDYLRVPVTDEKAPKEIDCDLLIRRCWKPEEGTSLVFNCQMGRGRTTTGMIIASLLHLRRQNAFPCGAQTKPVPEWFAERPTQVVGKVSSLKSGFYGVVRSLLRILEFGTDAKSVLDTVIDATNHMQNLREAIYKYRERLCLEQNERKRNALFHLALEYLERYCVLIAFAAYVSHPEFDPTGSQHVTFEAFMAQRPEFVSILQRLLRKNPMSALGLYIAADKSSSPRLMRSLSMDGESASSVVSGRRGKVLGQYTILKEDHFPGIKRDGVRQVIEGAPNFRGMPNLPVYGVGMPTVNGIREIFTAIGAGPASPNKTTALWFNWREEPLVYINGKPFVLREDKRPFKNMKEYTNINQRNLEKMERRLKEDVQREASKNDGCILVALETQASSKDVGMLEDKWETITDDFVQTPASVYQMLQEEGYAVDYHRLPLTDGTTPDVSDVDQVLACMETQPSSSIVFNCQNGVGRTTVGMIIAALVYCHKSPPSNRPHDAAYDPDQLHHVHDKGCAEGHKVEDSSSDETDAEAGNTVALTDGSFLAVRRLMRLLDNGLPAKRLVDLYVDSCDLLVNVKAEIGQFRKGHAYRRPETQHRHAAYNRGVGYLHRYCFLIAVSAYIHGEHREKDIRFQQWITSRQDIALALDSILQNPSAALSLLLPRSASVESIENANAVSSEEERRFLAQRQFPVLNSGSILKGGRSVMHESSSPIVPDLKHVRGKNIYTIGDPSVNSLQKFLSHLRLDLSIPQTVIIRDIREELVVYIRGIPYTRRDLERPVASLYHAGVATEDLERMEEMLCEDVISEAKTHSGTVLLHHEMPSKASHEDLHHKDDITHDVQNITPAVVPMWGHVCPERDVQNGVCTPKDVYSALMEEGYQIKFERVPLSRGRTPQASDLDKLGRNAEDPKGAVHLIIARAASGSSARFSAAFFSLMHPPDKHPYSARSSIEHPKGKFACGEYRSIMHLCRVLPNGLQCKASVDAAIDACVRIGSLREDILSCIYAMDANPQTQQLGLHYMQRYFFLIAYQCYRSHNHGESFEAWVEVRKELCHLLSTIRLE